MYTYLALHVRGITCGRALRVTDQGRILGRSLASVRSVDGTAHPSRCPPELDRACQLQSPNRAARATACSREGTSSLVSSAVTWVCMVARSSSRRSAIVWLSHPSATSRRTSISRAVRRFAMSLSVHGGVSSGIPFQLRGLNAFPCMEECMHTITGWTMPRRDLLVKRGHTRPVSANIALANEFRPTIGE
jgi:hypothetical protein